MIKAIIADDEVRVCQLINKLIDWENIGIKVVGEANDGISALNMIIDLKPEIVITDIRMPGIEGLDIIKKVREEKINTSFIIISGYKHFEYAQSAVKYGVEDYILKPINKEELTSILVRIKNKYEENRGKRLDDKIIKEKLEVSINKLRKQYMTLLLSKDNHIKEDIERINKEYGFSFEEESFMAFTFKIDKMNNEGIDKSHEQLVLNKINSIIEKEIKGKFIEAESVIINSRIIFIINFKEEEEESLDKVIKLVFEESKKYIDIYNYYYITLGLGSKKRDIEDLKKSVDDSLDSVKRRIFLGFNKIIKVSERNNIIYLEEIIDSDSKNTFINMIEAFDTEGINKWNMEQFKGLSSRSKTDPLIIYYGAECILNIFFKVINDINITEDGSLRIEIEERIDRGTSINEIRDEIYLFIKSYIDILEKDRRNLENKPIRIAKQYIEENYSKSISLEDIAAIIHLNPVYFSVIFKKETGMNFSDYLISVRIKAAKELLKDISYSIYQVADMVGYKDSKYFSKLFLKVAGIKPTEYRKLYS